MCVVILAVSMVHEARAQDLILAPPQSSSAASVGLELQTPRNVDVGNDATVVVPATDSITVFGDGQTTGPDLAADQTFEVPPVPVQPHDAPTNGELVSILKQRLPKSNETIEMQDAPKWFQEMMQQIVRDNVPDKYVDDKDWGKTDKRWDGLQVKRKGFLRLSTKRKWKEVNDGTWKRYEIKQINPQKNLTMRIENVHDAGSGKVAFDVLLKSKLEVFGRVAKWTKGVKVYSVSADAVADAVLRIHSEISMKMEFKKFPPDVLLVPVVTQADLDVPNFRLNRISRADGPLVKALGKSVHKLLLDKIEDKRDRLPEKINRQIAKNQDKMRLSLSEFAANKWNALTGSAVEAETSQTETKSLSESKADSETRTKSKPTPRPTVTANGEDAQMTTKVPDGFVSVLQRNSQKSAKSPTKDATLIVPTRASVSSSEKEVSVLDLVPRP